MVGKKQPVTCVETGKVYSGQRECSRDLGVTVTAVNHVLMGRCEKVRGFTIRLATGDEIFEWQKSQPKRLSREEWKDLAVCLAEHAKMVPQSGQVAMLIAEVEGSI